MVQWFTHTPITSSFKKFERVPTLALSLGLLLGNKGVHKSMSINRSFQLCFSSSLLFSSLYFSIGMGSKKCSWKEWSCHNSRVNLHRIHQKWSFWTLEHQQQFLWSELHIAWIPAIHTQVDAYHITISTQLKSKQCSPLMAQTLSYLNLDFFFIFLDKFDQTHKLDRATALSTYFNIPPPSHLTTQQ